MTKSEMCDAGWALILRIEIAKAELRSRNSEPGEVLLGTLELKQVETWATTSGFMGLTPEIFEPESLCGLQLFRVHALNYFNVIGSASVKMKIEPAPVDVGDADPAWAERNAYYRNLAVAS